MSTILIVDDMLVFRTAIAASLKRRGHVTVCAGDGIEAFERLRQHDVDLILLDGAMPRMDGLAFLEAFRDDAQYNAIPVILMTGVSERDYVKRAKKLGACDYLLKSRFSMQELYTRVASHLANAADQDVPRSFDDSTNIAQDAA
jgi:CheY-like chemotaxis protein